MITARSQGDVPVAVPSDIPCPKCGQLQSMVVDSRGTQDATVRRRRKCGLCGERYTTKEVLADEWDYIVGRLELMETVYAKIRDSLR